MTIRKQRKKIADQKREHYKIIICQKIKGFTEQQIKRGYSHKAAFLESLANADNQINNLIKQNPQDAHLIRASAYSIKREFNKILKGEKAK